MHRGYIPLLFLFTLSMLPIMDNVFYATLVSYNTESSYIYYYCDTNKSNPNLRRSSYDK